MKNIVIYVLVCFNFCTIFSQKEEFSLDNSLKENNSFINQVLPIVNDKNNDIAIFFIDAKNIYGYLLDEDYVTKKTMVSNLKTRKYKIILGESISNNNFRIYLTNLNKNEFGSAVFSFDNNQPVFSEISLDLSNEQFVQTANYTNEFYLLTITKISSKLNIYKFDENANYEKNTIDFDDEKFNKMFGKNGLYLAAKRSPIKKIDSENPNSIDITSEMNKMYVENEIVTFTFDKNKNFTNILRVNLNTLSKQVFQIQKPYINIDEYAKNKSNSFIFNDNIYMLSVTAEKMIFNIKNYKTDTLIKEFIVSKQDTISFKNTPFIKESGNKARNKKSNKTEKFLKSMINSKVGISVYQHDNNLQVTIGGKKVYNTNKAIVVGVAFGLTGVFIYNALNSTSNDFNTYSKTSSTYFKSLFDLEFNHIKSKSKKNAFDKIVAYKKQKRIGVMKGEVVFKHKNYFLYGYYNNRSEELYVFKFEDE